MGGIEAKKSYAANTVISQVLRKEVNLHQVKNIDLICKRVAEHYLRPGSDGKSKIVLSVNGKAIEMPYEVAPEEADPHVLRARGRELLQHLVNEIGEAFAGANVPSEVAYHQAEDIASQLGREDFLDTDQALCAAPEGQRVYQQGINVLIRDRTVSFHKTTTFAVNPDGAQQAADPGPMSPPRNKPISAPPGRVAGRAGRPLQACPW
ncbi:hypothetical protein [Pandoraea oxalativorans]|uniref:Uncharacterized protein n=1 Tax=Pandoraea oxalativorans TaxID=573737 RepID=A0A0G3IC97_9BURK|nr:hypothetical protein [Pandoraea oxalativorans]AKK24817.1 hypothetical protein MB84_28975 [Pandoraea oxalativorans]